MSASRSTKSPTGGFPCSSTLMHEGTFLYGTKTEDRSHSQGLTTAWHDLHEWQRDNEFIRRGYRRAQNTWRGCVHSTFGYFHNETVNIHSHLGGALMFFFLLLTIGATEVVQYRSTTWKDQGVFTVYLASAAFCLTASAVYHACECHSLEVMTQCKQFDYAGIIVLAVGSFYPPFYYAFFCAPHWQIFYLGTITVAGIGAASIVLNPEYGKPSHRGMRTAVFLALGLFAVLPVSHTFAVYGFTTVYRDMGFRYIIIGGSLCGSGALIYANRVPERWAPGWFDYVGSSHQIFHVLVVAATLCTYACALTAFEYRHGPGAIMHGGVCI